MEDLGSTNMGDSKHNEELFDAIVEGIGGSVNDSTTDAGMVVALVGGAGDSKDRVKGG